MIYKATLDKTAKLLTIGITILFIGIAIGPKLFSKSENSEIPIVLIIILFLTYGISYGFSPKSYIINENSVVINRLFKNVIVNRSQIKNVLKLENGIPSNTASKAMMLQNAQLSNALDKAVAQMGDAMSLMDYSDMPAERVEAFVDASTNADRNEAQALFDEIAKGNRYIKAINKGADWASPFGSSPRHPLGRCGRSR